MCVGVDVGQPNTKHIQNQISIVTCDKHYQKTYLHKG